MGTLLEALRKTIFLLSIHNSCAPDYKPSASNIPALTLITGKKMPSVGYGTFQARDEELEKALDAALEAGYRHIDTAHSYQNEKAIGNVLNRWLTEKKIKREDLFLVTKLPIIGNRPESVSKYLKKSLQNLQVDYVDMYLIHAPFTFKDVDGNLHPKTPDGTVDLDMSTDHIAVWKEMEKHMDAGLAKAIGLSNFNKTQIERVLKNCKIRPSSLQIELHPHLQQNELVDFCKKNNIIVTAYCPLGSPGRVAINANSDVKIEMPDILGNPIVKAIAKKHSKTTAQVILRFDIERGIIPIPKSTNPERLKQNLEIFDFKLDQKDMQELKTLDAGVRILDFKQFDGIEKHPEYPFK